MNTMLLTNFYIAEAARWYRLAADQGYGPAKYALGEMYADAQASSDGVDVAALRKQLVASLERNLEQPVTLE